MDSLLLSRRSLVAGGIVALTASFVTWLVSRGDRHEPKFTRFIVPVPGGHVMDGAECPSLAISLDGTLAFVASGMIYLKRRDDARAGPIAGTVGAGNPFFSHDGKQLGFCQNGQMKKTPVAGGPIDPIKGALVAYDCACASWGSEGIVYRDGVRKHLLLIDENGGPPETLTKLSGGRWPLWPQVVDDGRQLLYTVIGPGGLWEDAKVVLQNLDGTGDVTTVRSRGTYGRYVAGHVVYADAEGYIHALPYDLGRREPTGPGFHVEEGVRVALWGGAASFTVSEGGQAAIVYGSHDERIVLKWRNRDGSDPKPLGDPLAGGAVGNLHPDGKHLALDVTSATNNDLWLMDADTGELTQQLTYHPGYDWMPVWSPDGRLAYTSFNEQGQQAVFELPRGESRKQLFPAPPNSDLWLCSWSKTGWLAYVESREGPRSIYARRIDDDGTAGDPIEISVTDKQDWFPQFSPDGEWVAYESDGRIFVRLFSEGTPGSLHIVSDEGRCPRWSETDDGLELFYWKNNKSLCVREVSTAPNFSVSREIPLFLEADLAGFHGYHIAPGGQRILLSTLNPDARAQEIHVDLNWTDRMKRAGG